MFKKILLLCLLLGGVVYVASNILESHRNQRAQTFSDGSFIGGEIPNTRFVKGLQANFVLTADKPISAKNIYFELIPVDSVEGVSRKNISITPEGGTVSANVYTYTVRIPDNADLGAYVVYLRDYGSSLSWYFSQKIEIVNQQEIFTAKTLTPTENELRVTGFTFSIQADSKDPTLYKMDWSGAGRGILYREVKGSGAKTVKQLTYQNLYPLDDSGLKDMQPFFSLPNDGIGETGKGDIRLINTTTKEQSIDVVIAPKGEDGSPAVNYAKTVTVKVPPSALKIASLSKPKNKLKAGDVLIAQFAPGIVFAQLAAPLRISDSLSLTLMKSGKNQKPIFLDMPKFNMDNTMVFSLPNNLTPGSYKLILKTFLGSSSYDIQVVK